MIDNYILITPNYINPGCGKGVTTNDSYHIKFIGD